MDEDIEEIFIEGISKYEELREWSESEGETEALFREEIEELKKIRRSE